MRANVLNIGAAPAPGSPAEFGTFIAAEGRKWSTVAKAANVHVD
jgi:hypothetical protein